MLDVRSVLYGLFCMVCFSVSDVVHSFIYLLRVHLLSCKWFICSVVICTFCCVAADFCFVSLVIFFFLSVL